MNTYSIPDVEIAGMLAWLALVAPDLRLIEASAEFADLCGSRVDQLPGRPISELLPALEPPLRQVLATGAPLNNLPLLPGGGSVSLLPVVARCGTALGVEVVVSDNRAGSLAAGAEPSALELSALIDTLVEHATVGIAFIDTHLRFRLINEVLAAINGVPAAEHIGRTVREVVPRLADTAEPLLRQVLATGRPLPGVELRGETAAAPGVERIWREDFYPVRGANGSMLGIGVICTEVTEQMRAEAERAELLARERAARAEAERTAARIAQLQAVTASLSEALTPQQVAEVISTHAQGALGAVACTIRLISSDGRTLDVLHTSGVLVEGAVTGHAIPLNAATPVAVVARAGEPLFFASRAELAADYPRTAEITPLDYQAFAVVPLAVEGRAIGSLVLTFATPRLFTPEDRTFILALAGQCVQALERARLYAASQEAIKMRDSFIAVAAHDLRSPLTVMLGQARMIERRAAEEGIGEKVLRSARAITQQVNRLNRMISAMLDLSRIQTGQLIIEPAPLDLAALAARVVAEIQPTLGQHRLILSGADQPLPVLGDEMRLDQVLHNLIGNAVKYSPGGGKVRVLLARRDRMAYIEVADQGIGIPAEALPRLFERYYRAPNAAARSISGMGIGLYAVREIVTLHGGTVTVTSAEGRGSTFTVSLPALAEEHGEI